MSLSYTYWATAWGLCFLFFFRLSLFLKIFMLKRMVGFNGTNNLVVTIQMCRVWGAESVMGVIILMGNPEFTAAECELID